MGLSSKKACSSGLDWKQTLLETQDLKLPKPHQQQTQVQSTESLKCPRCESANTKFCYYNNYNKSQPRYFCRACKRHWTKGGTLRNVPVGGGRKNKRVKKSTNSISSTTSIGNMNDGFSSHITDQKTLPSSFYQALTQPPSMLPQQNLVNTRDYEGKDFGMFTTTSTLSLPQNNSLLFPFSTSNSFDTTTCSSSNVYNYYGGEEFKAMEEPQPTMNSVVPNTKPWETTAATSGGLETSKYWNWEDIDSMVSTDTKDLWDDSESLISNLDT